MRMGDWFLSVSMLGLCVERIIVVLWEKKIMMMSKPLGLARNLGPILYVKITSQMKMTETHGNRPALVVSMPRTPCCLKWSNLGFTSFNRSRGSTFDGSWQLDELPSGHQAALTNFNMAVAFWWSWNGKWCGILPGWTAGKTVGSVS